MVTYAAPLDDIRFCLTELFDYEGRVATLPGFEDASPDLVDAVLEEAAKFCINELLPLNRSTVADRGKVRKERIAPDAFGWQMREFSKLQKEMAQVIEGAVDEARLEVLRQQLERRNIHVLAGHSYDRPIGSRKSGAKIISTKEAVEFEVDLPAEANQPSYMVDTVRMIRAGLAGGISPGFRVPPASAVASAEVFEPEPGNPGVQVRVITQAVLHELSIVARPAYSETEIDVRAEDFAPASGRRRRLWL